MSALNSEIESVLGPVLSGSQEVFFIQSARKVPYENSIDRPRLLIHPLRNITSLPLMTRRRLVAPFFDIEGVKSNSDSPLISMLRQAAEIDKSVHGEERALRWRDKQYQLMSSVIVAEGLHGIFHGLHGCVRLVEDDEFSKFEITEELQFNFFDGWKTLAHRSTPFGQNRHFFHGWSVKKGFEGLCQELQNLYDSHDYQPSLPTTDLFVWSNQDLSTFPLSLIQKSTHDAFSAFSPNAINRGIGILFLSIDGDSDSERTMDEIESLGLQRSISDLRITFAPGKNEKKSVNNLRIKTLNDVYDSPFEQKCEVLLESLGLLDSQLFEKQSNLLFNGESSDLNEHSFIVLTFECWNGTWSHSLTIDGEHIMS